MTLESSRKTFDFEDALDITGYGKYNLAMQCSCCLLILAMYLDIFGFSVLMPAVACDMSLSIARQGILSAVPLMGITFSSYAWGFFADTMGRRRTLFLAMPIGSFLNFASSMAPNYVSLIVLKLLSAMFVSCANAAAFVLLGESVPKKQRSKSIFIMACATFCTQWTICLFALPIFSLTFKTEIVWLNMYYRPWRLLMQVISIPGVIGIVMMIFLKESPKYLITKGRSDDALNVLKFIYKCNTGMDTCKYPVECVYTDDVIKEPNSNEKSFLLKLWHQTAPLFKPPLLKNSVILYYVLLCAYMISTGYTMWVPTMTNAYFAGNETNGYTFCEVASRSASVSITHINTDCNSTIKPSTLYAVICYSVASTVVSLILFFLVGPLGKKTTTLAMIAGTTVSGVLLLFVRIPILSIALFYIFLFVALILGSINSYLVELNPTYLRGMATCLSVVVARGFGFLSVQLIATLLADYCTPMIVGYVVLNASGLLVAAFLPPDEKKEKQKSEVDSSNSVGIEKTKL
ncbi:hypothetical protein K1T71_006475 [Dendrolimus kikuchii]|uniref:Uncharacterized protein n=1 Tax=Dendrolimus kikuchii TaxID=765133 RepID=A0ACC1D180_9NEOP|nr:hypothetical protein K1T71_006475 [Dendrolimus kikuchii]